MTYSSYRHSDKEPASSHTVFPMEGEKLRSDNLALLQQTIWAPVDEIEVRQSEFHDIWKMRWTASPDKTIFQSESSESPFSEFSSKGWKIHIAFEKGKEENVSRFLYGSGLYFKTQEGMGTWFNGTEESGSTIYTGSYGTMQAVASHLMKLTPVLTDGPIYPQPVNGKRLRFGSGSDVEVAPKIMARFDVAKTEFGWHSGNDKYAEEGLPSWVNAYGLNSALPLLKEDSFALIEPERQGKVSILLPQYASALERTKTELVADFGHDYVLGQPGS